MIKFHEWQISNIERNVDIIKKEIKVQESMRFVTLLMLVLNVIAIVVACGTADDKTISIVLVLCSICILALYVFIVYLFPFLKKLFMARNRIVDTGFYVKMFDDKVCKYVMQAKSFEKESRKTIGLEQRYYCSEILYYISKSVLLLKIMLDHPGKIFTDSVNNNQISLRRLKLVLELINECVGYIEPVNELNDELERTKREINYISKKIDLM